MRTHSGLRLQALAAACAFLAGCGGSGGADPGGSGSRGSVSAYSAAGAATDPTMTIAAEKQDEKLVALPAGTALDANGLPVSMPERSAVRFLNQATFGATPADVANVGSRWREGWLQEQMALPITQTHWDRVRALQTAWFNAQPNPASVSPIGLPYELLDAALWQSFIASPDQLRKRVAYALSQVMVVSMEGLAGNGYQNPLLAAAYFDVLERNAFGNFRSLLKDIALSPAMGMYLSHRGNQKAQYDADGVTVLRQPDENFAREVMQLFSIGLVQLNLDGTRKLGPNGKEIETYSTDDVMGLARVFTGWNWQFDTRDGSGRQTGNPGATSVDGASRGINSVFCECYRNAMVMVDADHSPEAKTFLGTTLAAGTKGEASLEAAIDVLFNHPNVGPFIGRQLIQRLVTSNPSPAYVARVAQRFNNNGAGVRGDMKAVIDQVLRDPEARSPLNITAPSATAGKVREPVLRMTGLARLLGLNQEALAWNATRTMNMSDPATQLGQSPLRSPSVFNFYRPGYVAPNSKAAELGLVAPELQIATETSVPGALNYLQAFVAGGAPKTSGSVAIDFTPWLGLAAKADAAELVSDLNLKLANGALSGNTQAAIAAALGGSSANGASAQRARVRAAMLMVTSAPEYLIQK